MSVIVTNPNGPSQTPYTSNPSYSNLSFAPAPAEQKSMRDAAAENLEKLIDALSESVPEKKKRGFWGKFSGGVLLKDLTKWQVGNIIKLTKWQAGNMKAAFDMGPLGQILNSGAEDVKKSPDKRDETVSKLAGKLDDQQAQFLASLSPDQLKSLIEAISSKKK